MGTVTPTTTGSLPDPSRAATVSAEVVPSVPFPVAPPVSPPSRRRPKWVDWGVAALAALGIGSGLLWTLIHPPSESPIIRVEMADQGYVTRLFKGTDLRGWTRRSGAWSCPPDAALMEGTDGVIEKLLLLRSNPQSGNPVPVENYRLQFFVEPQTAKAVELHFGFAFEPERNGPRWVLRLTPGQFQIGESASDSALFVPREPSVPDPPDPHQRTVVTLEQQPGGWFVKDNQSPERDLPRRTQELSEFRFRVEGGPAAFSDVELTQLQVVASLAP